MPKPKFKYTRPVVDGKTNSVKLYQRKYADIPIPTKNEAAYTNILSNLTSKEYSINTTTDDLLKTIKKELYKLEK